MNLTVIIGNWYEQKGKLVQKIAAFTNNYPMNEDGKNYERYGKLQIKLGKAKEIAVK
jgi:uncharacterized protein YjbJ (UPF0337 family)